MWWQYVLVFIGAFIFDVVPFPLPPAFTIMVLLLILFKLNAWWVIVIGVAGSLLGRYVLTLYVPRIASKVFKPDKNKDVQFLGKKLKEGGWKSQLIIVAYSLLPLPTTPIFVAGGIARINPLRLIPAFFIGKFTSDAIAVLMGKYATENFQSILKDLLSWKSIAGLILGLLLLCALLFIDWRTLIQKKKFQLKYKIWK